MDIILEIILIDSAKDDIRDIYEYISNILLSVSSADKLIFEFEKRISALKSMPKLGSLYGDTIYRKIVVKNYIIIYYIDLEGDYIYISRVVYSRRSFLKI